MRKSISKALISMLIATVFYGCNKESGEYKKIVYNPEVIHESMNMLTKIIVHDIFSPPVASRIYAYPSIAAYEVMVNENPEYQPLAGQLRGLTPIPKPEANVEYCYPLASIHAFLTVGKAMIFSEQTLDDYRNSLYKRIEDAGIPEEVYERSVAYGELVAKHILAWADKDMYKQTRTFAKFEITDQGDRWKPTPPAYMDAIEPHWSEIRPFVLDSASQFIPPRPTAFKTKKDDAFFKEAMDVYETGKNLTEDQEAIAKFWDCNPYVSHLQGHLMFATKKITPGGHWEGITAIACRKANADFIKTTESYALVSVALFDGFISCWDEKYRSNLIRPETVINQYIDPDWLPVLQTPPFPEYTSGHSVVSTAAATILTKMYGESFAFTDTTEVAYGLPPRSFDSFIQASQEAAISRLYGGIHYRPAINNGVEQGRKVGELVISRIHTSDASLAKQ